MCVVRTSVWDALAAAIACAIPELDGHICVDVAPAGEVEEIPNLTIEPGKLVYDPNQALEMAVLPGARVVYSVGAFEGPVAISIVAANVGERETLTGKLIDLFLSTPLRPGVLMVPVTSCPDLGAFAAAFELDDDETNNGRAFDRRYEHRIAVNAVIPALTTRRGVYTIQQLRLGIAPVDGPPITSATMVPPAVEVITIHEDGTFSPYP